MSTILAVSIVSVFAGCGALALRKRFEEMLPLAVGLIITVLYAFGLSDSLDAGLYAVMILAAVAVLFLVVELIRKRHEQVWHLLITPGTAAFGLILLWLLISYRGYMYIHWDDFSHWGLAVKNMFIFSAIPSGVENTTITYADYPPASTLFSWFWTKLSGVYNEGDAQRAVNLLTLCYLLPAMKDQKWKYSGRAVCLATSLFVLPILFDEKLFPKVYVSLQVDGLLGCVTFYAVYTYFFSKHDLAAKLGIALSLLLLPLIKSMGILFAVLVLLIITADLLTTKKHSLKQCFLWIIGMGLFAAAGILSWKWYLTAHRIGKVWNAGSLSFVTLLKVLLGGGQTYQKETIRVFIQALISTDWGIPGHVIKISYLMLICLLWVVQYYLVGRYSDSIDKKRYTRLFFTLDGGLIIYLFGLLILYLFVLRPDEAKTLNSFERYLSAYMIVMTGLTMMTAIKCGHVKEEKGRLSVQLIVLLCLALVLPPESVVNKTVLSCDQNDKAYQERMLDLMPQEVISKLDSSTDLVYVVASEDNGYQYYLDAYQLTPVRVQDGMWTTWVVAQKNDFWYEKWSIEYTPEQWAELLLEEGFTHVYLDTVDERFVEDFCTLFESRQSIRSGGLYSVKPYENRVLLLDAQ